MLNWLQVSFLAEQTGCDAARLSAPVAWQGSEEELAVSLFKGLNLNTSVVFTFRCRSILVRASFLACSPLPWGGTSAPYVCLASLRQVISLPYNNVALPHMILC